jgi:hypothetical protein
MFVMWSVLEVTQRVQPTCIIKTDVTYQAHADPVGLRAPPTAAAGGRVLFPTDEIHPGGANGQGTIGAGVPISAETGAAQASAVAAAGSDAGQCRGAGFLVALNILIEHID